MSLRRPSTASTGRPAFRGPDRRRGGRAGLGRTLLAWLAVLAVVVQTTVPDFAMAARNAARIQAAAAQQLSHGHHDGGHRPSEPAAPTHGQDHEALCAFCLALGTHGLSAAPAAALPVPAQYGVAALPDGEGVRPRPLFLIGHSPRAPPASQQV